MRLAVLASLPHRPGAVLCLPGAVAGALLTVAKRTSDAAHGGQITLTDETYRQLPLRALARRAWVLHMGQHLLGNPHATYNAGQDEDADEYQLYQVSAGQASRQAQCGGVQHAACMLLLGAGIRPQNRLTGAGTVTLHVAWLHWASGVPCTVSARDKLQRMHVELPCAHARMHACGRAPPLARLHACPMARALRTCIWRQVLSYEMAARLALFPPLRTHTCLVRGVLAAPAGVVAVAFMYIVGLAHLMAWNSELAMEALEIFHRVRRLRRAIPAPCALGGRVTTQCALAPCAWAWRLAPVHT